MLDGTSTSLAVARVSDGGSYRKVASAGLSENAEASAKRDEFLATSFTPCNSSTS